MARGACEKVLHLTLIRFSLFSTMSVELKSFSETLRMLEQLCILPRVREERRRERESGQKSVDDISLFDRFEEQELREEMQKYSSTKDPEPLVPAAERCVSTLKFIYKPPLQLVGVV